MIWVRIPVGSQRKDFINFDRILFSYPNRK